MRFAWEKRYLVLFAFLAFLTLSLGRWRDLGSWIQVHERPLLYEKGEPLQGFREQKNVRTDHDSHSDAMSMPPMDDSMTMPPMDDSMTMPPMDDSMSNMTDTSMDHSSHTTDSTHMMAMYFTATTTVTVWFKSWTTDSNVSYAFALIGIFVLCLIHEGIATARLTYKAFTQSKAAQDLSGNGSSYMKPLVSSTWMKVLTDTILYAANLVTSYLLMLLVMTYNVGVFFVIIGGLPIGRLLFYKQRVADYRMLSGNAGLSSTDTDHSDLCCPAN